MSWFRRTVTKRADSYSSETREVEQVTVAGWIVVGVVGLFVFFAVCFGLAAAGREYGRYQKRADAKNNVTVTHTQIRVAEQQAKVNRAQIEATKAEAEKRYQESIGIKRAQDEISKTLTPLYVQHEAIQKLPGARAIYVPSGPQGIPQVYNVREP